MRSPLNAKLLMRQALTHIAKQFFVLAHPDIPSRRASGVRDLPQRPDPTGGKIAPAVAPAPIFQEPAPAPLAHDPVARQVGPADPGEMDAAFLRFTWVDELHAFCRRSQVRLETPSTCQGR